MSSRMTPIASYRGSSSTLDQRGWNLPLSFQEVFTAIVRLRYRSQSVPDSSSFRMQLKQALKLAEQEAHSRGYKTDDTRQVIFAVVAFLDESVLSCRNSVFSDWSRLPLQTELFGHQNAGEIFFQDLRKTLGRPDSQEVADILEVYYLCLLLGFKGRYGAGGGDLHSIMGAVKQRIQRVRGQSTAISPRGALPADAVRIARSDPWVRKLAIIAVSALCVTAILFVGFKFTLVSAISMLSDLATKFN